MFRTFLPYVIVNVRAVKRIRRDFWTIWGQILFKTHNVGTFIKPSCNDKGLCAHFISESLGVIWARQQQQTHVHEFKWANSEMCANWFEHRVHRVPPRDTGFNEFWSLDLITLQKTRSLDVNSFFTGGKARAKFRLSLSLQIVRIANLPPEPLMTGARSHKENDSEHSHLPAHAADTFL